jgi:transporter family protein
MDWLPYALASAVFAATTAILCKLGIAGIPSNLATAIRTVVILLFAWAIVLVRGEHRTLAGVKSKAVFFLVLSGVTTGLSWLAYFRALQLAPATRVAPIDKLSLPLTIVFAMLLLHESVSLYSAIGVAMMMAGAILTLY